MRRLRLFAFLLLAALAAGCGGGGGGSSAHASADGTTTPLQSGRLSLVLDSSSRQDRIEVQGDEVLLAVAGTPARVLVQLLDDSGDAIVGDTEITLDPADPTARRTVTIHGIPFGTWRLAVTTFDSSGNVYGYFQTFVTIGAGGSTSVRAPSVVALQIAAVDGTTVPVGLTGGIGVTGILSDGSGIDLSNEVLWTVSDPSRASVGRGRLNALGVGPVEVTARYGPLEATQAFTISDAVLQSLQVDPPTASVAAGFTQAFTATGTFSDGTARAVTSDVSWTSSDETLALPTRLPGEFRAVQPGLATITARHAGTGVSGSATLRVTPALLQSLRVEPLAPSVPLGVPQQFRAEGLFSDGSTQDLTGQVQWSSSDAAVATLSNLAGSEGLASTLSEGQATVKALHAATGLFAETTLDVTAAALTAIDVTPKGQQLPDGRTLAFTAMGTFTDGSVADVTPLAFWTTSDPAVATASNGFGGKVPRGVVTAEDPGIVTIGATIDGITGDTGLEVTAAVLESLALDSATNSFPAGRTLQVNATGVYSDGTTRPVTEEVTWSSLAEAVATVSNATGSRGLVTGKAVGPVGIRAVDPATGVTQVHTVQVTAAVLESLAVTSPGTSVPRGRTLPFTATGTFSDATTRDMTQEVNWFTSDPTTASVSFTAPNKGIVTGNEVGGPVTVTAQDPGTGVQGTRDVTVTAAVLDRVEVDPLAAALPAGRSMRFTATGIYSDGTTQALTSLVTWSSTNAAAATVANDPKSAGEATGVAPGDTEIRATDAATGLVGAATLSVTNAELVSIDVTPSAPTLPKGRTQQFTATGVFTDGSRVDLTDAVTWDTAPNGVGSITPGGLFTALTEGPTAVDAFDPGTERVGTATVQVTAAVLDAVEVRPDTSSLPEGRTAQLQAFGTYSTGQVLEVTDRVTWSSGDPSTAPVSSASPFPGKVQGLKEGGPVAITAVDPGTGRSDTATVTVTRAVLESLSVTPAATSVPAGLQKQFAAQGVYSNGNTLVLTDQVAWSSTDPAVAGVSNAAGSQGLATTLTSGETRIQATLDGVTGQADLAVTAAELVRIDVAPQGASVAEGRTQQFTAQGLYTDGNVADLTTAATWTSGDSLLATIGNGTGEEGLARGVARGGPVEIRATVGTVFGVSSLTVTPAVLEKLEIQADDGTTAAAGVTFPLRAVGTYSDGSMLDMTGTVDWSSDDTSVATVVSGGRAAGGVTGKTPGTANITATDVPSGTQVTVGVTINAAVLQSVRVQVAGGGANDPLPVGVIRQYEAIGTYSDGERDVTAGAAWRSDTSNAVAFTNPGDKGKVQGAAVGTAHVYANVDGVEGGIEVTVSQATLTSLRLEPQTFKLIAGATVVYKAKGEYSDGSTAELNQSVAWASSDPAVATIDTSDAPGLVTGVARGNTTITATDVGSGITAAVILEVVEITKLEVFANPVQVFLLVGPVQQKAIAELSDGTTNVEVTGICNWRLQVGSAGKVGDTFGVDKGLLEAFGRGTDVVFAREPGGKGLEGAASVEFFGSGQ